MNRLKVRFVPCDESFVDPRYNPPFNSAEPGRFLGAFAMASHEYDVLAHEIVSVISRYRTAILDNYRSDYALMATDLRFPAKLLPIIETDRHVDPFAISRVDFVICDGRPVVLELNVTSSVGAATALDVMHGRLAVATGLRVPGSPNLARLNVAIGALEATGSDTVLIPHWPWSHIKQPHLFFESTCRFLADRGADGRLVPLQHLAAALKAAGSTAVVLRLFDLNDARQAGFDLRLGVGPEHVGRARWVMGGVSDLISSKSIMAHRLPPTTGLTSELIASTCTVGDWPRGRLDLARITKSRLLARQRRYVLKPAYGHSGHGVVIGPGVSQRTWDSAVSAATRSPSIAQVWHHPDACSATFEDYRSGRRVSTDFVLVFGMYVVSGKAEGVLVRGLPSNNRLTPLNSGLGAMSSALMLS